jgi:hypothetical protein
LLNNELAHWVTGDAHPHLTAQARNEAIAQMVAI